jgi:hypothetical protein
MKKYNIKLVCWGGDEFLRMHPEKGLKHTCYDAEPSQRSWPIAIFDNLDVAKEHCEFSDEYIVEVGDPIEVYTGKVCSDCHGDGKVEDNEGVIDCGYCEGTGEVK